MTIIRDLISSMKKKKKKRFISDQDVYEKDKHTHIHKHNGYAAVGFKGFKNKSYYKTKMKTNRFSFV